MSHIRIVYELLSSELRPSRITGREHLVVIVQYIDYIDPLFFYWSTPFFNESSFSAMARDEVDTSLTRWCGSSRSVACMSPRWFVHIQESGCIMMYLTKFHSVQVDDSEPRVNLKHCQWQTPLHDAGRGLNHCVNHFFSGTFNAWNMPSDQSDNSLLILQYNLNMCFYVRTAWFDRFSQALTSLTPWRQGIW